METKAGVLDRTNSLLASEAKHTSRGLTLLFNMKDSVNVEINFGNRVVKSTKFSSSRDCSVAS